LGIARRIGVADVVDRLDQAAAEEVGPDAVGEVAGEPGIVRSGEPRGKGLATLARTRLVRHWRPERVRAHGFAGARMLRLWVSRGHQRLAPRRAAYPQRREERLHAV